MKTFNPNVIKTFFDKGIDFTIEYCELKKDILNINFRILDSDDRLIQVKSISHSEYKDRLRTMERRNKINKIIK